MKLMKSLAVATLAGALGAGTAMAEEVKIGIAAEPYPPFASLDASGEWGGWEVEIINAVCDAAAGCMGRHHSVADRPADRRHHGLDVDHRRAHEDDRFQ